MTVAASSFDLSALLAPNAPAPGTRWSGAPEFNFVGGNNDPEGVPVELLAACAQACLQRDGSLLATYNLTGGPQGYEPLRRFVAAKVKQRGIECTADDVLITSGSLQGLDLVNDVFLNAGDTVVVEQFTYGGALSRLYNRGIKVIGAPLDEDGIRPDALADILHKLRADGTRAKYIYTIPTLQNPTSSVMSEQRRLEILRLAGEHDTLVFEDECYADLIWTGERPPAMRALDRDGRVVHIGSFSKSVAPALRVGYLVADWPVMGRLLSCKSDAGSGAVEQMMLAEFCNTHFDAHVESLNQRLKRKAEALVDALDQHFGTAAEYHMPVGGIFLWVKLPEQVDTLALAGVALAEGIAFNPGPEWSTDAAPARNSLRICFASPSVETLQAGVAKLAEICRRETGVPARIANIG